MSDQQEHGPADIGRREAVKKAAIAGGALVWATPVVQSIGMSSALAQNPTPVCDCTGATSSDVILTASGLVAGTVGPIMNFPDEPNGDCLVGPLTVQLPGTGPIVTAAVDCVSGSTNGTCQAGIRLADVRVDLAQLNPAFDIQVGAGAVESTATCSCPAGCNATTCVIPGPNDPPLLVIAGQTVLPNPGTALCNFNFVLPIPGLLGPLVSSTVELLTTSTNPCQATFLHINLSLLSVLGAPLQTVDLVVARATAVCA